MRNKASRLKRSLKIRAHLKNLNVNRLTVHKSSKHIYAQILSTDGKATLASACSTQVEIKSVHKNTGNIAAASDVGKLIAERAIQAGVTSVAFDRSGFKYHGRIKALADSARESGLKF